MKIITIMGKFIFRVFLLLLAIALIIVFLGLWINRADVPPSDLVREFKSSLSKAEKVSDQENAYVYMLGLASSKSDNPILKGIERKAALENVCHGVQLDLESILIRGNEDYRSQWSNKIIALNEDCIFQFGADCFAKLEASDATIEEWEKSQAWLLDRYQHLLTYSMYKEVLPADHESPTLNYGAVLDAQKLYMDSIWRNAKSISAIEVQAHLEKDFIFWRMILSSSEQSMTKIVAWRAMKRNLTEGNFILRRLAGRTTDNAIPPSWYLPLTHDEMGIERLIIGEWYTYDKIYKNTATTNFYTPHVGFENTRGGIIQKPLAAFFQPQATSNRNAKIQKKISTLFDTPIENFQTVHAEVEQFLQHESEFRFRMYNPIVGFFFHPKYLTPHKIAISLSDLEIGRRAALLTAELRLQKLTDKQKMEYVHSSNLKDLYTGRPFDFNAKDLKVSFYGLRPDERGTFIFFL